ncbi:guanosine nucleotide diphosphate dissociation inhibitor 1-like [Hordeum vulgare]|nr:guanosine nucleotide diphosphate dissociation inhibitor 1-like [Hordeum vulgare]
MHASSCLRTGVSVERSRPSPACSTQSGLDPGGDLQQGPGLDPVSIRLRERCQIPSPLTKVLHMDRNDYYGGDSTSLNLNQLWKKFRGEDKPPAHLGASRDYNVDMVPKDLLAVIRIFLEDGHQIGCAQSYAKNMGLYGQRAGCLSTEHLVYGKDNLSCKEWWKPPGSVDGKRKIDAANPGPEDAAKLLRWHQQQRLSSISAIRKPKLASK